MTNEQKLLENSKVLSDIELHDEITALRKIRGNHLIDESDYTDLIIALIQNQKITHADMVIGEDTPLPFNNPKNYWESRINSDIQHENNMRAEQRGRNV